MEQDTKRINTLERQLIETATALRSLTAANACGVTFAPDYDYMRAEFYALAGDHLRHLVGEEQGDE